MSRETRAGALAFLAAWATLFAQVAVHRIVSAKMLNNFAFFVLSLTMLGFAASGAWLSRHPERWRDPLGEVVGVGASVFTWLVAATAVLYPRRPSTGAAPRGSARRGLPVVRRWASSTPSPSRGASCGALLLPPAATRRLYGLDSSGRRWGPSRSSRR
jgi:hypothetical protein